MSKAQADVQTVTIVLSDFARCSPPSADVDYWVMQGVLSTDEVEAYRSEGFAITVFDTIADDDDAFLQTVAMAALHNSGWRELYVLR